MLTVTDEELRMSDARGLRTSSRRGSCARLLPTGDGGGSAAAPAAPASRTAGADGDSGEAGAPGRERSEAAQKVRHRDEKANRSGGAIVRYACRLQTV